MPGFEAVEIAPFQDEHRLRLATRLYRAVELSNPEAEARKLNKALEERKIPLALKDRPLFVTLLATLYLKPGGLPPGVSALYRENIRLLLDRWTRSKPDGPNLLQILNEETPDDERTPEDVYRQLAALAYTIQKRTGNDSDIRPGELFEHFQPLGELTSARLIAYLTRNAGVLIGTGQKDGAEYFQFAHRTFQEYLVAVELARLGREKNSFELLRDHVTSQPRQWQVAGPFVADVLAEGGDKAVLWKLLNELLEGDPEEGLAGGDGRWWRVWLAARIVEEHKLDRLKVDRTNKLIREAVRDWLIALLQTAQALPLVERAFCGRVLALLGDPRPGVGVYPRKFLLEGRELELSQFEWCSISAPPAINSLWVRTTRTIIPVVP